MDKIKTLASWVSYINTQDVDWKTMTMWQVYSNIYNCITCDREKFVLLDH